ncbi:tetratricopeptide repeat protein [Candidatus Nomurabacteria bacterium]|nr:tetratricopeptide repeat protein [Candidatus Nomurabacteria bacterium]
MISRGLLYALAFVVPIFTLSLTRDSVNFPKVGIFSAVVLVVSFLYLLDFILIKQAAFRRSVVDGPIVFFLIAVFLSSIGSVMPSQSFFGRPDVFLLHFFVLLLLAVFYSLIVQMIHKDGQWYTLLYAFVLSGAAVILGHYLSLTGWEGLSSIGTYNPVSQTLVEFSTYLAIVVILTAGLALKRSKHIAISVACAVLSLLAFSILLMIDVPFGWVSMSLGLAALLIVAFTHLAEVRVWALIWTFALFALGLFFLIFHVPEGIRNVAQLDISLAAGPSYQIAKDTLLDNVKYFLIGSGTGTFSYTFSLFRDPAFNLSSIAAFERFSTPFSTLPAVISEFGSVGAISFLVLLLIAAGSVFGGWLRIRPSAISEVKQFFGRGSSIQFDVFTVGTAFLVLTIAMFYVYFGFVLWFTWWLMLALTLSGLHKLVPEYVKEKIIVLKVAPQYSLLLSFGLVLVLALIVFYGSISYSRFVGEYYYTRAALESSTPKVEAYLKKATEMQKSNSQYYIAYAKLYLQKARVETAKEQPDTATVGKHIERAISYARQASEANPQSIDTWETLAMMYLNARPLASQANDWAKNSLEKAVELEPSNAVLHWRLADTLVYGGEVSKAQESLKKAIALKPNFVQAYIGLSNLFEEEERINDAILVHKPIMELLQDNPDALFNLGRLFYNRGQEGDLANAKRLFQRVVELEPRFSNAHYSLGLLFEREGNIEKAKYHLEKVMELNPGNEDVKLRLESLN